MRPTRKILLTAGAAAAGAVAAQRIVAARRTPDRDAGRRHVITVNRQFDEIGDGPLPGPLAALADGIEVERRPAPGGRGTEIAARPRSGAVSGGDLRRALREARSELEVGYVLLPGGPTTEPTPLNKPLRAATAHGREGGLL
jgi:hypothetical protein